MIRREPFKSVLEAVASRLGVDPEQDLQSNQAAALARYIDSRVRMAWEGYDWPWSRVTEARVFADRWDELDAEDIALGDVVYHLGKYWTAAQDEPTDEPADSSEQWMVAAQPRQVIGLTQARQTPISECLDVWTANPETDETARKVVFRLVADGIYLPGKCVPAEVWVTFSLRVPRFVATPWDGTRVYAEGARVYYPEAGDCFVCLGTHSNVAPPVADVLSTYWVRQELPQEIAPYVELGAWADALDEDGDSDKAKRQEDKAEDALADAVDRIELKQKQTRRFRVLTR